MLIYILLNLRGLIKTGSVKEQMSRKNLNIKMILGLALGSEICFLVIAGIGDLRTQIPLFLICYAAIFLFYLTAAALFLNFFEKQKNRKNIPWLGKLHTSLTEEQVSTKEFLTVGIAFGIIFRLTLLFTAPTLSDDIYRYVWDGKVASQGINPYVYPPDAEELKTLRDDSIYPNINHKEISTIYPPVSQLTFWGLYKLDPSLTAFKAAFFALDLLTIVVLILMLKNLGISLKRVLLYVWNPLIIVEISGSGHADIIGIFLLSLSLWFLTRKQFLWSNFTLALSFLTKFIALFLLPFVALVKKENKSVLLLFFVVFATLLYLPYADAGEKLFSGLLVYTNKWRFNDSLFSLIFSATTKFWTQNTDSALEISKRLISVMFAGLYVYTILRFKKDFEREGNLWFFKIGLIFLGGFFLLSPTAHPWYLCWLLPFLVVVPNRAWILLTGLAGLSYWILIDYAKTGIWQETSWVKWVEYSPFYLLLIFDGIKNKIANRSFTH